MHFLDSKGNSMGEPLCFEPILEDDFEKWLNKPLKKDTNDDWSRFEIDNRTKYDASISTGLALMACNKHRYRPNTEIKKKSYDLGFKKYNNKGNFSKIIK